MPGYRVQASVDAEVPGPLSNPTFCFLLDEAPRLVSIRGDSETLLGIGQRAFLSGKTRFKDLIHPDDDAVVGRVFSTDLEPRSGVFNIRMRHADGRIRCCKGHYVKKPGRGPGRALLHLSIADARTVREAGDDILLAGFKSLIEHTTDYLYVKNRNHVILAASRSVAGLTGASKDRNELVGETDYDIFPEGVADIGYRLESLAFAEGKRVSKVQQLCSQDGTKRWIDDRKYPITSPNGEIVGIFGIATEITQYIETEQELKRNIEELREAQDTAGLHPYVLDLPGKVWHMSPGLESLLGLAAEEERAFEDVWPLIHPDDRAEMEEHFGKYLIDDRSMFDSEYRIIRPNDKAVRWLHVRGRLEHGAGGKPVAFHGSVQDITQRKQAEAVLQAREEFLREAQEIARLGNFVLDIPAQVWKISPEVQALLGIDAGYDHSLEGFWPLIHPDDRAALEKRFRGYFRGKGSSFEGAYRIVRWNDREVRWIRVHSKLELDAQGKPLSLRGTLQDITEQKKSESALRASKELLQLFIEQAPVALAMLDREMRYLAVSCRWLEEERLKFSDVIGRSHYEVFPDLPESWKDLHRRVLAGEVIPASEVIGQRADGSRQWLRREIQPWQAGDGSVGGIMIFSENIMEQKRAEAELRESKELLQLFIGQAPVALAMFDTEMRYLAVSRRWLEQLNLTEDEILGRCQYDVLKAIPESWQEEHRRAMTGEAVRIPESRIDRADGAAIWYRREILPWRASDGSIGGIVVFAEDITERKEAEDRLRLAASVFTGAREGIVITDRAGTILEVNEAFTRITGYTREEVLGRNPRMLQSGLQPGEFFEKMWSTLARDGHWSGELWNRTKSGDAYAETLTINAIRNANGDVVQYVGLFSDVTEIKEHERQLEHIAHYDALTGLPNRALLADRLRQAMAHAHRTKRLLAVAYFDIDGFKTVNDRYGQLTGDVLLTALAFRMKRALREGDTLARLGGDEFAAVILDLDDPAACNSLLNRLLAAAAEEAQIGEVVLRVSASAGVAFYPQMEDVDAEVLLRQAGQAMYQAKLAGRNRFSVFDPSQDRLVRGRHENIEHIRQALEAKQFVLHYQPKVNMRTGKVIGAEALIRWQHPERGLLPPGMFLPVIEGHPLAVELGHWVIETALTQMESWQAEGFDLPVSVNVGATELQQAGFADRLRARLAAHPGVKPSSLELEVVETSAMQDVVRASQVLTACREIGVAIGLDDFGTGYSSLTYLKRLPANVLKIDQSFVRDMLEEPENLTILEGVLGLAAAFHRQVIAEGVETVEHGLMLLQMGCDFAQGYGIARPMPAGDVRAWAATWRPDPLWAEVPPVHADNRAALYASVEHRSWLGAFEAFLEGKRATPPLLDIGECRFGAWLETQAHSARRAQPAIQALDTLHRQFHSLAAEICAMQAGVQRPEGLAQLRELYRLYERCRKRLIPLARAGSGKGGENAPRDVARETTGVGAD
jgi:diguanylate cyclase (GGDEF)-like protein/PAS domain S-box-containing protein